MVDCSSGNYGDLKLPYAQDQSSYLAPPSNITRMILKRKSGSNTRPLRMVGGFAFQINGVSFASSAYLTGYKLGLYGETVVFERNATDITNNNWRVYQL